MFSAHLNSRSSLPVTQNLTGRPRRSGGSHNSVYLIDVHTPLIIICTPYWCTYTSNYNMLYAWVNSWLILGCLPSDQTDRCGPTSRWPIVTNTLFELLWMGKIECNWYDSRTVERSGSINIENVPGITVIRLFVIFHRCRNYDLFALEIRAPSDSSLPIPDGHTFLLLCRN